MATAVQQPQVVSAARFVIDFPQPLGRIAFAELGGIASKVGSQEYIYNDDKGQTIHTKQFGKTEPPTITLKRGLDTEGNRLIMLWHHRARTGDPTARLDGLLTVMDAKTPPSIQIVYKLHNAWCSEVTISGMKAGASDVATIECKLTCEEIVAA
jgi:phage tail-like protein